RRGALRRTVTRDLGRRVKGGVGDTGFEPVTSSVSGKRAAAAPIALATQPGVRGGGGYGIRNRVHGFAGRCLTTRPTHRGMLSHHTERRSRRDVGSAVPPERTTGFEPATLTLAR